MEKHLFHRYLLMAGLAWGLAATSYAEVVVFEEDFESYAPGSDLSGQGGWVGDTVLIGDSAALGSRVALGTQDPGTGVLAFTSRLFDEALGTDRVYTLHYDALATSAVPTSSNSGLYFNTDNGGTSPLGVGWFSNTQVAGQLGWFFDARNLIQNSSGLEGFVGGYDSPVQLTVVVDPIAGEVYGLADFGAGAVETARFAMTQEQFDTITGVVMLQEYRFASQTGVQIDDVSVTTIPEPATAGLVIAGGLALIRRQRV